MKNILLGIAIILFGIVMILVSSGGARDIGLVISLFGLIISIIGFFNNNSK